MMNSKVINTIVFTVILGLAASFSSCKKKDDNPTPNPEPTPKVTFSFTAPKEGDTFHHDDTVWIKGTAVAEDELHGYEVKILNKADNSVAFSYDKHAHGKTITVDSFWVNKVQHHSDMFIEVWATKDHEGNKESKKINFHCHP